jgi:AcrR family transcriptional regulator
MGACNNAFVTAERAACRRSPGAAVFEVGIHLRGPSLIVRRNIEGGQRDPMTDLLLAPPPSDSRPAAVPAFETPPRSSPKSRRTRARILDCALQLFADAGYAGASNARIAEAARLTRGAMLYHFPTREALVEAAIAHIQDARTALFAAAAARRPAGADASDYAIDAYWRLLHEPAFVAFAELEDAARTDPWLESAIRPAQAAFDRAQMGAAMGPLVQAGAGARFQASRDLARFVLEGLARANLADDADGRTQRLLEVVKRATHALNRKGSAQDLWPEA